MFRLGCCEDVPTQRQVLRTVLERTLDSRCILGAPGTCAAFPSRVVLLACQTVQATEGHFGQIVPIVHLRRQVKAVVLWHSEGTPHHSQGPEHHYWDPKR
jgi:hypothetical protein